MLTPQGKAQHWTKDTVYAALLAFVQAHHRAPHPQEWCPRARLPSPVTARKYYGSLQTLYRLVGVTANRPPPKHPRRTQWKPEAQVLAVRRFQAFHHRWPQTADFRDDPKLPHPVTVHRAFGTLAELRRRAGMPGGGHEGLGGSGRGGGWTFGKRRPAQKEGAEEKTV
jgi:hypothetical protein